MNDLLVLGTDTDAGKTTFSLLWLARFADAFDYWKPVETGTSDSATIGSFVPQATVHPAAMRCVAPLAPPLAARAEGRSIPPAAILAEARPPSRRSLLIESFGSPFSPLNETELQIDLLAKLLQPTAGAVPYVVLVSSSKLGAIGRTLQTLAGLHHVGIRVDGVALIGERDDFAEATIRQHQPHLAAVSLAPPTEWSPPGLRDAADRQALALEGLAKALGIGADARSVFEPPSAAVADLVGRDAAAVWHPYTPLRGARPPLACVGAEAEFLHLADGRRLIDGISSWWTILHGHRHPPLMAALRAASEAIDHVLFAGVTHPWGVELAERLLASAGWKSGLVFYSDNGSTAVEVALKIAYQHWVLRGQPQRTRFVGFEHGYHGDTFGAMAVGRDPVFFGAFEPLLFQADILPLEPNRLADHLHKNRDRTAAVIVEPLVQGAGGMRMHSAAILRQLREAAADHDVLFIADEVMTGGGRTGTLWAHQAADIRPDLICAAKTLAGGVLPLAATLVAADVSAPFDVDDRRKTFFHGHSFTAHPLACAVACANFRLLAEPEFLDRPRRIAAFWEQALGPLRASSRVRDVRILGSIAAIELDLEGGYLAPQDERTFVSEGVFLRPLGSVLYAMPPLATSADSLHRITLAMAKALSRFDPAP